MGLNWKEMEETLHRLVIAELQRFSKRYKNEQFYGLVFDCNSDYGGVLLSLNTPAGLIERVKRALDPADPNTKSWADWGEDFSKRLRERHGLPPAPPKAKPTPEELERDYRWAFGDWKFMDIQSRKFESVWKPVREAIENAASEDSDRLGEQFMEMACRVMVRLERGGYLDNLPRTRDFKTLVCNHDEALETAETRLSRIRRALAVTPDTPHAP